MHVLLNRLLALPQNFTSSSERSDWAKFLALLPDVPIANYTLLPAQFLPAGSPSHNYETIELYAVGDLDPLVAPALCLLLPVRRSIHIGCTRLAEL